MLKRESRAEVKCSRCGKFEFFMDCRYYYVKSGVVSIVCKNCHTEDDDRDGILNVCDNCGDILIAGQYSEFDCGEYSQYQCHKCEIRKERGK